MNISDDYIEEYYNINPTINDFFLKEKWNNKKHIQPNIYSEEYNKLIYKLNKKFILLLKQKKNLSFDDKLLLHNLKYTNYINDNYIFLKYLPIDLMNNLLIEYVTEANGEGIYLFKKKDDYNYFLKRIKSLNNITETIIKKLKQGIKHNITIYRKTIDKIIENLKKILSLKLYYKKKVLINRKIWDEGINKYLVTNLNTFLHFLLNEYYIHTTYNFGLHNFKKGKDCYIKMIKNNTFKDISPEKIHKIGFKELKKLQKLNIKGESSKYKNEKDILKDLNKYKNRSIKIHDKLFHGKLTNNDIYQIKKIPLEKNHLFAYYISGDIKNIRKGTFFINTSNPNIINKDELYILSLHEGIPGHHYQINNLLKNNNFTDYRKVSLYNSYSEGWALYCEHMGIYKNKYYTIQYNIHRCVRLIIDTGIHYYGWSYDKCFNFMKKNIPSINNERIHNELLRYINIPSQALTYKIGEKTFIYLKNKYIQNGGNIKDFHKIIMDIGPCPLDFLVDYFLENNLI